MKSGLYFLSCLWCDSFFFFNLFRAAPMTYGGSQARGWIGANAAYTTAHDNAGSLTHWVRPGIESASSWILVGFVPSWATAGAPGLLILMRVKGSSFHWRGQLKGDEGETWLAMYGRVEAAGGEGRLFWYLLQLPLYTRAVSVTRQSGIFMDWRKQILWLSGVVVLRLLMG